MPYREIRGRRLHYWDEGRGPAICFAHSYLCDHRMWSAQIAAFASRFRCIVPDLWGHGVSDPLPEGECTLETLAADHLALLAELGVERCTLVGVSIGGMWGLRAAARPGSPITGLVLAGATMQAEPDRQRRRFLALLEVVEALGAVPLEVRQAVVPGFFAPDALRDRLALVAELDARLKDWPAEQLPSMVRIGRAWVERDDFTATTRESVTQPTLVLVGDDDSYRPPEEARELDAALADSRLCVLDGVGHLAPWEAPAAFNVQLEAYLRETGTRSFARVEAEG